MLIFYVWILAWFDLRKVLHKVYWCSFNANRSSEIGRTEHWEQFLRAQCCKGALNSSSDGIIVPQVRVWNYDNIHIGKLGSIVQQCSSSCLKHSENCGLQVHFCFNLPPTILSLFACPAATLVNRPFQNCCSGLLDRMLDAWKCSHGN